MKILHAGYSQLRRLAAAAIACAVLLPAAAGAENWKLSSSFNYDTGKYGTEYRTDSVYMPFTLKRYYSEGDLSVTVPYLSQSSRGQVTWVGGKPVRSSDRNAAATASKASGLGDIMLRGTYNLKQDGPGSCALALAGKLKLPSADEDKGLGTGEMDEGAGLEFAKEINSWTLLADGYYTIIGDPAGVEYNNQVSLDLGFYAPLRENLGLTVMYETQSALVDGNADPRSLSGTLSYAVPEGMQISCGVALGMSDGSPALGLSAGLSQKF